MSVKKDTNIRNMKKKWRRYFAKPSNLNLRCDVVRILPSVVWRQQTSRQYHWWNTLLLRRRGLLSSQLSPPLRFHHVSFVNFIIWRIFLFSMKLVSMFINHDDFLFWCWWNISVTESAAWIFILIISWWLTDVTQKNY